MSIIIHSRTLSLNRLICVWCIYTGLDMQPECICLNLSFKVIIYIYIMEYSHQNQRDSTGSIAIVYCSSDGHSRPESHRRINRTIVFSLVYCRHLCDISYTPWTPRFLQAGARTQKMKEQSLPPQFCPFGENLPYRCIIDVYEKMLNNKCKNIMTCLKCPQGGVPELPTTPCTGAISAHQLVVLHARGHLGPGFLDQLLDVIQLYV